MSNRTRLTAAQMLVEYLIHEKIPYVIGIHGHGDMCISEALAERKDKITFIQAKNEQYGGLAAVAYAKTTNRPLAVITSTGPGSTNLVTVAATAYANRLPILLIPGDTFASGAGPALQQIEGHADAEMRATDTLKPVSRYFVRINRAEQLQKRLPEAFNAMLRPGEEGPAVIAMPMDVQAESYDYDTETLFRSNTIKKETWTRAVPKIIDNALEVVSSAKRPFIIAGGGVSMAGAQCKLATFAEILDAPVVHTQAGMGTLRFNHPLNVFSAGVTGTSCGNELARNADVIIGIGTRYTDFTTCSDTLFRRDAVFVNINISPFDVVKQQAISVWGDAWDILDKFIYELSKKHLPKKESYLKEIGILRKQWTRESNRLRNLDGWPMAQSGVIGTINDFCADEDLTSVIVAAAGSLPGDLQKLWRTENSFQYHVEYGYSTMGYEIAAGVGIKLANPDSRPYVLVGDGSFLMGSQELVTAVQERLAFTVIIFDNGEHRSIRGCQEGNGFEVFGTKLRMRDTESNSLSGRRVPVDFKQIAEGYGAIVFEPKTQGPAVQSLSSVVFEPKARELLVESLRAAQQIKDKPSVIYLPIDPDRVVGNYGAWWDVPRPEVSIRKELQEARKLYEEDKTRQIVR